MRFLRLLALLIFAAIPAVAQGPTFHPEIEGPWEFAGPSGIDGIAVRIPKIRGEISRETMSVSVYHRREGAATSGSFLMTDTRNIDPSILAILTSDSSFSLFDGERLRIRFPGNTDLAPVDLDLVYSPTEQHWTGTWSRNGQSSRVVLERPHPAVGATPSKFVGNWEAQPDSNSHLPFEPGSLHIVESNDGALTAWLDRIDFGSGEPLKISSTAQDAITLETTGPGPSYQFRGRLSEDRQVLTGAWVPSLSAPTQFRRKP